MIDKGIIIRDVDTSLFLQTRFRLLKTIFQFYYPS